MKILFLYSEVMGYTLSVIRHLRKLGYEIHLVYWDQNKKTPFLPDTTNGVTLYRRSACSVTILKKMIDDLEPSLIYVSGRMDAEYLKTCLYARRKKIKIVSGFDNQWRGTLKNHISVLLSRSLYKKYFDYMWVPGVYQYEYVKKLGYAEDNILFNLYSGDVDLFLNKQSIQISKRIVFVGRFVEVKGIERLLRSFGSIEHNGWKLIMIGNGPLKDKLTNQEDVEVIDFMSPSDLADFSKQGGVFVLPSIYEAWGVVVHEFAAAGYPLICSDICGAATVFVKHGHNGFCFDNNNDHELTEILQHVISLSSEELIKMGQRSKELSLSITPEISAHSLLSVVER